MGHVFISYSRLDQDLVDKIICVLADAGIKVWIDREGIPGGVKWRREIVEAIKAADAVLLALSPDSVHSDNVRKEVDLTEQFKKTILPVEIKPTPIPDDLSYQLVGVQRIDLATNFDAGARRLLHALRLAGRPVLQALSVVEEVVNSGEVLLSELPSHAADQDMQFPTVSAFWQAKSTLLPELGLVTVPGTLSQFAPMLMGPPRAKRLFHREFRRAIETDRSFGEKKRLTINACMSISAGQMVQKEVRREKRKRLLGLYGSIVRNAIPIFVLPEYYEQKLLPEFRQTGGSGCFEATVTGRIFLLDNNFIRRFLVRQDMDKIIRGFVIDDLCRDAYALEVGGPGTKVQRLSGPPRYLDGDVWLVVQADGRERFVTGFVDITNAEEREEEMQRLREEVQGSQILACYNELESIAQLLDSESVDSCLSVAARH